MAETTSIAWCDKTFNPWEGCTKVSHGCAHCYAEARNHRFGNDNWGKGKPRRRIKDWTKPLGWNQHAWVCNECGRFHSHRDNRCQSAMGHRPRVFPSIMDWLDDEVPIEWLADFLKLIHDTPNLDWLLLTKRPENWYSRIQEANYRLTEISQGAAHMAVKWLIAANKEVKRSNEFPSNVWIGVSVEDQKRADERIPELVKIPAKLRFLSVEPLLGPIKFHFGHWFEPEQLSRSGSPKIGEHKAIHWCIVGGESGPKSRPCNVQWIRSIVGQCRTVGVPCFVKQLGSRPHTDGSVTDKRYLQLNHPKGGDPSEWPEELRGREFPTV